MRHKAKQDSQSIEGGHCRTPGVVVHHRQELDIDRELERQVGSRLVAAAQIDRLGSQVEGGHRGSVRPQGRPWRERAPPLAFSGSLPPSCELSTPFEFL